MSENLLTDATGIEITGSDAAEVPPVAPPVPPKRGPGHRGQDIRDTMAEMAAKAHEISLEAGSKMASAMRDVIGAAAGISAFAIESARDLVNYMVRRGQMSQEEATKLLREVEEAHAKRPKTEIPKKEEAPPKKSEPKTEKPIRMLADPPILTRSPPKPSAATSHKVAHKPAAKPEKVVKGGGEKAKASAKASAKAPAKKPAPKKK